MSRPEDEPRTFVVDPRKRRILKWIAIAGVTPSVALFVGISFFVARTEYMHDPARCPFEAVETRTLPGSVGVLEEKRVCQEGVEEHRWVVKRADRPDREIGRRRLMQPSYEHYAWSAELRDGWVHVEVQNEGVEDAHFREGPE